MGHSRPKHKAQRQCPSEIKIDAIEHGNDNLLLRDDIERQFWGCKPISDFGFEHGKCNNPNWQNNLLHAEYSIRPKVVEVSNMNTVQSSNVDKWLILVAGLFGVALVRALAAFRSRREAGDIKR